MPRFEVRLEAQEEKRANGEPEYRVTRLDADDEDQAKDVCERLEMRRVLFAMPPHELERAEEIEADPDQVLSGQLKGHLFTHRQRKPYLVTSVTEVEGR